MISLLTATYVTHSPFRGSHTEKVISVPIDNIVFKIFYFAKAYVYQKMSLRILRCSWLNIWDQTEEAWEILDKVQG